MTRAPDDNRVSLAPADWLKLLIFLGVQTVAIVGGAISVCERIAANEARTADLQHEVTELRHELRK